MWLLNLPTAHPQYLIVQFDEIVWANNCHLFQILFMHANPANQIPLIRDLPANSRKQKPIVKLFFLKLVDNFADLSFVCCLNTINYA